MAIREFNNLEEMERYYDESTNTYVFKENGEYIEVVVFNFDLSIDASIDAYNIEAWNIVCFNINADNINAYNINADDIDALNIQALDIKARDIIANDINAWNITANNILYYSVCFARENIKCKSIKSERENHKHFVLDGELITKEEN